MGKSLVIVESPAKIKTLKKFLGPNFIFESSIGHIRDLPQREFGIDVDGDFEPKYVTLSDKKEVIEKLKAAAKKADIVYLSPDPDREGEAIAWHIASILPQGTKVKRTPFQSITKEAVQQALDHPRDIDMDLVDAQQARRLLDRIVGYKISPILARKVKRGRSGGWLVDRMGTRVIWPLAAIGWSICVGLLGTAAGFWSFMAIRFLLGVTEGPHFPAMTRSISNWLSPTERATALSLGLIAIPFSAVIGSPITATLVADYGWRQMFFIICSIGIVWAFVWYYLFRDRPEDSKYVNAAERKIISAPDLNKTRVKQEINWRFILFHPSLIANNIAYFAYGYALFFATLWLPGYFLKEHNLNLKTVGWYLVIPWLVAAAFLQFGGMLSDYLYRKTASSRLARSHVIWVSQLLSAIFFVILSFTHSLGLCILFLSLALGFSFLPQPAFFSVNIDVAKERAGSAQGITSGCLSIAGIFAPAMTGWIIDLTGSYQGAFLLLAGITLIAVVTVVFFHHPDRAVQASWKKALQ